MEHQIADDVAQTTKMIIDSLECSRQMALELSSPNPGCSNNEDISQCKFHLAAAHALLSYLIRQHFPDNKDDEIKFL
jgi:hypothetical protein